MTLDDHFFRLLSKDLSRTRPADQGRGAGSRSEGQSCPALQARRRVSLCCSHLQRRVALQSALSDGPMGNQVEYDRVIPLRSGWQEGHKAAKAGECVPRSACGARRRRLVFGGGQCVSAADRR
jgi:hypothetical protein